MTLVVNGDGNICKMSEIDSLQKETDSLINLYFRQVKRKDISAVVRYPYSDIFLILLYYAHQLLKTVFWHRDG